MSSIVFHIGYGKTATTWMQELFFTRMHEEGTIHFAGKTLDDFPEWLLDISYLDNIAFDREYKRIAAELLELYQTHCLAGEVQLPFVASSEAFTNSYEIGPQLKRLRKVLEVAGLLEQAKIVCVFRDPVESIVGKYNTIVWDSGACMDFRNVYTDGPRIFTHYKNPPIYLPDYDTDSVLELMRSLFPDVLALDYKEFSSDKEPFLRRLCAFIGADYPSDHTGFERVMNPKVSDDRLHELRVNNLLEFIRTNFDVDEECLTALAGGIRKNEYFSEETMAELKQRFHQSREGGEATRRK